MRPLLVLALFFVTPAPLIADTGTYVIEQYDLVLRPLENGDTEIEYYQKWRVIGGKVPWITVGCANPGFRVLKDTLEGNIASVTKANTKSWSGVKIQLDEVFFQDQTFEVRFSIVQSGLLFDTKGSQYVLSFIPGWYKNSGVKCMNVSLQFFNKGVDIETSPTFTGSGEGRLTLFQEDLSPGETPHIKAYFPKSAYAGAVKLGKGIPKNSTSKLLIVIVLAMISPALIGGIILILIFNRRAAMYGGGGHLNTGAATTIGNRGCVVACACACVACACACACAGGGAAGCDRKMDFSCPLCKTCKNTECGLYLSHA